MQIWRWLNTYTQGTNISVQEILTSCQQGHHIKIYHLWYFQMGVWKSWDYYIYVVCNVMWAPVLWGTNQEAKEVKQDNIKMRTSTENLKIRNNNVTYFPPISTKCNKGRQTERGRNWWRRGMNILKKEFWYDWGWTLHCAVRIEFKMRPSADLWEKWRILINMRKPKNNIFSELYFDQYEVDVNAKNIRYFEEEAQPFIKVISLHVFNSFSCSRIYCMCYQQHHIHQPQPNFIFNIFIAGNRERAERLLEDKPDQ